MIFCFICWAFQNSRTHWQHSVSTSACINNCIRCALILARTLACSRSIYVYEFCFCSLLLVLVLLLLCLLQSHAVIFDGDVGGAFPVPLTIFNITLWRCCCCGPRVLAGSLSCIFYSCFFGCRAPTHTHTYTGTQTKSINNRVFLFRVFVVLFFLPAVVHLLFWLDSGSCPAAHISIFIRISFIVEAVSLLLWLPVAVACVYLMPTCSPGCCYCCCACSCLPIAALCLQIFSLAGLHMCIYVYLYPYTDAYACNCVCCWCFCRSRCLPALFCILCLLNFLFFIHT